MSYMSAFGITARRLIFAVSVLVLFVNGCDRGHSTLGTHIYQKMDDTKRQITPSEIQAALRPFFTVRADSTGEITNRLPDQISSLPIFSGDADGIMVFLHTNDLTLMVGSGFGHWGMVVIRPGSRETYEGNEQTTSIPWDDGVYFFSQY